MAEPVIVPITLEVTDIDMEHVDFGDAKKTIEKSLKDVKQSVQDVFSGISDESVNKAVKKSMNSVSNSVYKTTLAYKQFEYAMNRAAKSSAEYKRILTDVTRTEEELARANESLNEFTVLDDSGKRVGRAGVSDDYVRTQVKRIHELESSLTNLKKELKPENFALSGSPELVAKLDEAYIRLIKNVTDLNESQKEFNQTTQDNRITDEYNELVKQSDKYKAQLEKLNEKSKEMETLGATDKAWEKMQYDVAKTKDQLDGILSSMRKLVKEGNAFRFGEGDKKELNSQISSYAMSGRNIAKYTTERAQRNESPYTADYQAQMNDLDKLSAKLTAIEEKTKKLHDTDMGSPRQFVNLKYDAEQLEQKIQSIIQSMRQMVEEGKAFKFDNGDESKELDKLDNNLKNVSTSMSNVTKYSDKKAKSFKGETSAVKKDASMLDRFRNICKGVSSILPKISRGITRNIKGFRLFHKSGRQSTNGISRGFKHLLKNVLTFGLGFRTIYYAIKRLRTIAVDGLTQMSIQFKTVNKDVSSFVTSFRKLKGSVATAFQPIASYAIPLLKQFMDYVSNATVLVAKFNATLTGQTVIYKAIAEEANVAAEAIDKSLASYDKLDVIDKDKGKSSIPGITYEEMDIGEAASKFAKMIKEAWQKADFTEVGEYVAQKLGQMLDTATNKLNGPIKNIAMKIAKSLATGINGLTNDSTVASKFGKAIASLINTGISALGIFNDYITWSNIANVITAGIQSSLSGTDFKQAGIEIFRLLGGALSAAISVTSDISTWKSIGTKLGEFLSGLNWGQLLGNVLELGSNILTGIAFAIIAALEVDTDNEQWKLLGTKLGETLRDLDWKTIFRAVAGLGNAIFDGIGAAIESATGLPEGTGKFIAEAIGVGLLTAKLAGIIAKILGAGGLLDAFKKKDKALDTQTKKTEVETDAVSELNGAFAAIPAMAASVVSSLGSVSAKSGVTTASIRGLANSVMPAFSSISAAGSNMAANIRAAVRNMSANIYKWAVNIASNVARASVNMADNVRRAFTNIGENIAKFVNTSSTNLASWGRNAMSTIGNTMSNIVSAVGNGLGTAWENFKEFAKETGQKVGSFFKKNWKPILATAAIAGLTVAGVALAPYTGGASLALAIPALANGAVIPPNKEFLAMLGDQKHGTNIEAPLETIKQAVAEVLASMGGQQTIVLELDGKTVARVVWDESEKRYKQTGKMFAY